MNTWIALAFLISLAGVVISAIMMLASKIRKWITKTENEEKAGKRKNALVYTGICTIGTFAALLITADTTAPELTTQSITAEYGEIINISDLANAVDDRSEEVKVTISDVTCLSKGVKESYTVSADQSTVIFSKPGEYLVSVTAADDAENLTTADVSVLIEDYTDPQIVDIADHADVEYGKSISITQDDAEENAIFVLAEDEGSDITYTIAEVKNTSQEPEENESGASAFELGENEIIFHQLGEYEVTAHIEDDFGNMVTAVVPVSVIDKTEPEITGIPEEIVLTDQDTEKNYLEGITSSDEIDGDVTSQITVDSQSVNYGVPGRYTVTYHAADVSGNVAEKTASVIIKDVTPPAAVLSTGTFTVTAGSSAPDYRSSITVSDSVDSNPSVSIDDSGVDYNTPGTYPITYTVTDSSGNSVQKSANVTVKSNSTGSESSAAVSGGSGTIVYVTDTGTKYHRESCGSLWNSSRPISKERAIASGYTPCKKCKP